MRTFHLGAVVAVVTAVMAAEPTVARMSGAPHSRPARCGSKTPTGPRRGRPRKFSRPSRSVTLTLPEDVITALQGIDVDLSRAVVRAVQPLITDAPRPAAEVTTFGDRAVIVVRPSRTLRERTGVELVPLSDGRALLAFDERLTVPEIELRLGDALADPDLGTEDRLVFESLAEILRSARLGDGVTLRQRNIIVLHWTKVASAVSA